MLRAGPGRLRTSAQRATRATPATQPQRPGSRKTSRAIMNKMSVADKVGQLFVVTFQGNDVATDSDIATLVRDYRVGGVVLHAGQWQLPQRAGRIAKPGGRTHRHAKRSTPEHAAQQIALPYRPVTGAGHQPRPGR